MVAKASGWGEARSSETRLRARILRQQGRSPTSAASTYKAVLLVADADSLLGRAVERIAARDVNVTAARTLLDATIQLPHADGIILGGDFEDGNALDWLENLGREARVPTMVCGTATSRRTINRACALNAYFMAKPIDRRAVRRFAGRLRPHRLTSDQRVELRVHKWQRRYALPPAVADVLTLAACGYTTREAIALKRGVTPETVKTQVESLLARTGDLGLLEAALRMLREA